MKIPFKKMHGLGNDFIIFDGRENRPVPCTEHIAALSNRKTGIGCDQIGVILDPQDDASDCFMKIYNAPDGNEVGACGNMTRCVAWLMMEELDQNKVTIQTIADHLQCTRKKNTDTNVTVNFGYPKMGWQDIPLAKEMDTLHIDLAEGNIKDPFAVNVGNPHLVFFVENCEDVDVQTYGPRFETDPLLPQKANIEFATVLDRATIRLRVWERDTGETQACGSAAFATHIAAVKRGLTERKTNIILDGGTLEFNWPDDTSPCTMTGDTALVFEGIININDA